jgi:hypothetical protein
VGFQHPWILTFPLRPGGRDRDGAGYLTTTLADGARRKLR